ncbi:MAG: hypothetical protein CVV24_01320 [Ignavibacteriae bacterium HGW-Ignavibacteriae-3]|nr:MAG: hypothetical protein CVV24_01320 [Ignavibacteriae bacterium HGW-Ignavibacteriae-3]
MADKMIHEMISAFATGCMDRENYIQFKNYITAGGDLPEGELGELRNIISMLPVILDLEKPDPAIKDMVAKKLIGMKEEIITQIHEGKRSSVATNIKSGPFTKAGIVPQAPPQQNTLNFVSPKESAENPPVESDLPEQISAFSSDKMPVPKAPENIKTESVKQKTIKEEPQRLEAIPAPTPQPIPPTTEKEVEKKSEKISSGAAGWIALLLTIILFTILGYFTYSSINSLNGEIKSLKQDIASVKADMSNANDFIANYNSLIEFFNYKDISVVNLTNPDVNEKSSARVLLSFSQKEGLIQFKNVKPLASNQSYQVWIVSKGQTYSLGVYQPKGDEYFKLTSFPQLLKEQIELFRVTIEYKEGGTTPAALNYLSGTFQETPVRARGY